MCAFLFVGGGVSCKLAGIGFLVAMCWPHSSHPVQRLWVVATSDTCPGYQCRYSNHTEERWLSEMSV